MLFWIKKLVQFAQDTQITEEAVILSQKLFHDKVRRLGVGWVGEIQNVSKYTMTCLTSLSNKQIVMTP